MTGGGWREETRMTVQHYRQLEVWQLAMRLLKKSDVKRGFLPLWLC